jgi:hypothetical protein
MTNFTKLIALITILISCMGSIEAQSRKGIFRDTVDNAFDISKWLLDLHGLVPVISPITEPAVGYGAVLAGVYFISKEEDAGKGFQMPDMVGLGGGLTANGTWFAGGGYFGFWKNNTIRYRGVMAYGDVNLQYYGKGNDFLKENPISFNIKALAMLQQAVFRIGKSNFWLGGNYVFSKTTVTLFEDSDIEWLDPYELDLINSGVTLLTQYENFNNILAPSKGVNIELNLRSYFEFLGSDENSQKLTFSTIGYVPVMERWVSGFRLESNLASQSTPFFMLPYINLRGVPAMRYQGEFTLLAETEQYVRVYKRWGLVGFAGFGGTIADVENWDGGDNVWNAGGGFRYLLARKLGLQMGMDVGAGPDSWAFYIIFGSAWLR